MTSHNQARNQARKREDPGVKEVERCLCETYGYGEANVRRVFNGSAPPKWERKFEGHIVAFTLAERSGKAQEVQKGIPLPPCIVAKHGTPLCQARFLYLPLGFGLLPEIYMAFSPPGKLKDQTFWLFVSSTGPDFVRFQSRIASRSSVKTPEIDLARQYEGEMRLSNS